MATMVYLNGTPTFCVRFSESFRVISESRYGFFTHFFGEVMGFFRSSYGLRFFLEFQGFLEFPGFFGVITLFLGVFHAFFWSPRPSIF